MLLICAISVVGPKKYRRKDFAIGLSEAGDFKESGETFAEVAREKFILTPGNRRLTHCRNIVMVQKKPVDEVLMACDL